MLSVDVGPFLQMCHHVRTDITKFEMFVRCIIDKDYLNEKTHICSFQISTCQMINTPEIVMNHGRRIRPQSKPLYMRKQTLGNYKFTEIINSQSDELLKLIEN